jgi:hypothetical protein
VDAAIVWPEWVAANDWAAELCGAGGPTLVATPPTPIEVSRSALVISVTDRPFDLRDMETSS